MKNKAAIAAVITTVLVGVWASKPTKASGSLKIYRVSPLACGVVSVGECQIMAAGYPNPNISGNVKGFSCVSADTCYVLTE